MRLIDGDKYCDFLNTYPLEKAQNNFMSFYREALQKTFEFEVKAIPIEWINENAGKYFSGLEVLHLYKMIEEGEAILNMLENWEKENETN